MIAENPLCTTHDDSSADSAGPTSKQIGLGCGETRLTQFVDQQRRQPTEQITQRAA